MHTYMVYLSINIVNLSLSSLCLSTSDQEKPILQAINSAQVFVKCTIVFWSFLWWILTAGALDTGR